MPRRKQGQSKETTGDEIKKNTDSERETNQNDPTEHASAQKELVSQVAEMSSPSAAGSFRNGSADCGSPVVAMGRKDAGSTKAVDVRTENMQIPEVLNSGFLPSQNDKSVVETGDKQLNGLESIETSKRSIMINGNNVLVDKVIKNHMYSNQNLLGLQENRTVADLITPNVTTFMHGKGQNFGCKRKFKSEGGDKNSASGMTVSSDGAPVYNNSLPKSTVASLGGSLGLVIEKGKDTNSNASSMYMEYNSNDCVISSSVKGKVPFTDCGDNSGEMSGLSPAVLRNTHQGNQSDSHKLNYRISSSVTETKSSISSDNHSLPTNKENGFILEDQGSFQLPSSVYGTSASSIETVLTGLCLFNGQKVKYVPGSLSTFENMDSSTVVEGSSCSLEYDNDESRDDASLVISKEDFLRKGPVCVESKPRSCDSKIDESDKETNSAQSSTNQNLNLFIPNRTCVADSSSPQPPVSDANKIVKSPQVTSPQILEQHITKIISRNAAIVETLDPLWARRYIRQTSVTSSNGDCKKICNGPQTSVMSSNGDCKKNCNTPQTRRLSEDKPSNVASNTSSDGAGPSKLQTALLGGLHTDNRSSPPTRPSTSSALSYGSMPSEMSSFLQCSSASLPPGSIFSKVGSSTVTEEELQGSAIKSLLSLKQGKFSCHQNSVYFSKEVPQKHPQNPEGSIIKDLLLKNKSKLENEVKASSGDENFDPSVVGNESCNGDEVQVGISSFLYQCAGCKHQFKAKDVMNEHLAHCKGVSDIKNTVGDYTENCPSLLNRCVSLMPFSEEKMANSHPKSLNLPASLNDVQDFANKGIKHLDSSDEDDTGHLLKKQLLSPLSRHKTTTSKKRKISEPVISMSKQDNSLSYQIPDVSCLNTKASYSQPLEDISITAHRCRSQSVHMFGGEVQILDGIQTKKLKISTNMQNVFSSAQTVFSSVIPCKKSSVVSEKAKEHRATLATVVVTIAQPVHNSGGTVMHLPTLTPPPSISPVGTLSNHMIASGIEKLSDLSLPSSKSSSDYAHFDSPTFQTLGGHPIKKCEISIPAQGRHNSNILSSFTGCTLSPSSRSAANFVGASSPLRLDFSTVTTDSSLSSSHFIFKDKNSSYLNGNSLSPLKSGVSPDLCFPVNSLRENFSEHIYKLSTSVNPCKIEEASASESQSSKPYVIPMVTFTPSSPTHPSSSDKEELVGNTDGDRVTNKKFLAPTRPTSLPLKKKPFTMVGSTLISPETPRPKKSCVQLYLNGHAYTYLGLKCSTRSTYCCIYRPQPMYVLQDTNPKLSMYSNWQVVPAKEELSGMTPGQMISLYNLNQGIKCSKSISTSAKLTEPLSFTHSSYWVYRAQEQEKHDAQEEIHALQKKMDNCFVDQDPISSHSQSLMLSQDASMECDGMSQSSLHSEINDNTLEGSREDERPTSVDNSNFSVDTDAASSDLEENGNHDADNHDSDIPDDSSEALGNTGLPQPPKRVRIFEGGFKSNEDYTYVRGRGRGKYVCEECGIRCKKPSMLKKHIRTHTDLRPYKCRHCSFAFKTKGNLTKHMKSKAHHKKCTELGIVPVPTTTDDSQIDEEALAKQEQLERKNPQFSDNDDIDEDDDDEIDDDCDDSEGLDEDCESDSGMMSTNSNNRSLPNGYSRKYNTWESVNDDQFDDSGGKRCTPAQTIVEQEAAHSLLHLSVLGEPSQWSNSTGEMANITPPPRDMESSHTNVVLNQPSLATSPQHQSPPDSTGVSGTEAHTNADPTSVLWLTPEPLGHRPRSYSADIPFSSHRDQHNRLLHKNDLSQKASENLSRDSSELGIREQYGRRYSISVTSEARRPNRILNSSQWGSSNFMSSGLNKWPEVDSSDQPMDLTVSRSNNAKKLRADYSTVVYEVPTTVLTVQTQDNQLEDTDETVSEQYQPKTIPVLSPQILTECDNSGENGNSDTGLPVTSEEHQSYSTNAPLPRAPVFYLPDISLGEASVERKEMEIAEDEVSPEATDYAACSPITPPSQEESAYYYAPEGLTGSHAASAQEEMPPASACHAEFILPSTSAAMDEGRSVCRVCNKVFAKSSQLRLHVNIHYFERPFRCDSCAVSFRTKGHLQKHKRSVSHYNKMNMNMTFGTPTVDNPRPFKCADCKIAFRIHGHLAKHLRSKMHIMKLECLGKLPFGMYAEMERSGVSLNEIDTTDCSNSLESLQSMATRLYEKDPRRMRWHNPEHLPTELESAKPTTSLPSVTNMATNAEQLPAASFSPPVSISIPTPSIVSINQQISSDGEVKQEPSDMDTFRTTTFSDNVSPVSSPVQYSVPQNSIGQELPRRLDGEVDSSTSSLHRSGTCHICGRLFKSAKFLQVHLYCDHSTWNPPAVGDIASQTVTSSSSGHSPIANELTCDLCGKLFPNQNSLQQHLLSHAQPRPFVCEICDAGFTSATLLASHLTTHQSVSTTVCSESGLVQLR